LGTCLNCDENIHRGAVAAPHSPQLSLTVWFAVFNSLSAFFLLALIALLLYLGLASQLKSQNHRYLHDEVSILERMIRSEGIEGSLANEINSDNHGEEYVKHYIRLLDKNSRTLVETSGMAGTAPHLRFISPVRDGRPGIDNLWRNAGGNLILGTAVWVDLGKGTGEQGVLEVALDVTNVQHILESYRHKIYGALFVGLFFTVMLSLAIARRGTRPLREMTEMFSRISVTTLDERISGTGWPKELGALALATNLMLDRLQDYFERLYNSARNLSHKIRTPLTILKGEAEVALSRERTVEELQDVIVSGLEENRRLVRLVDNVLFLSDAEIGKLQCVPGEVDARGEIEKVLDFYSPVAEEKEITIRCQGSACVRVDASLFRKATAALVSNALTYNAPGGTIDLTLSQGEGFSGALSVSDSGCGIPDAEKLKVFDRFYRIYATRHRDPHGTGLGLPIVKAIMDLHKGAIALQSKPEQGTTVTLRFPALTP
jgi:two-component system, OmpR family, heavy metal sensor histidine kinase CusS